MDGQVFGPQATPLKETNKETNKQKKHTHTQ